MKIRKEVIKKIVKEVWDTLKCRTSKTDGPPIVINDDLVTFSESFLDAVYEFAEQLAPSERPLFRARVIGLAICIELYEDLFTAMTKFQETKLSKIANLTLPISEKEIEAYCTSTGKQSMAELRRVASSLKYQ